MTVFAKADEVSELLNCGKSTAYKIMRQLNNELKEKGYMTISGNVTELICLKEWVLRQKARC